LLGLFSFGGSLCYSGPWSSTLALVCFFFGLFRVFGGCVFVARSLFLFFLLVVCTNRILCLSSFLLCASVRWAGYFCFEIGSWCLAAILFDVIWCSLVYQWRGVPC